MPEQPAVSYRRKNLLLAALSLPAVAALAFVDAVPQDPCYHNFADQRTIWGIPHFWNVVSNLPFVIVGLLGLNTIRGLDGERLLPSTRLACRLFFLGIMLIGFGSAWYHILPTNETLVWDRLPMTVAFMAFFAFILGEFVSENFGRRALFPLIGIGMLSVLYWHFSEQAGAGDLRLYALVQFLPIVLIPLILLMYPAHFTHRGYLWMVPGAYVLAKVSEVADHEIFGMLGQLSGHSFKHLFAALAPWVLLLALKRRQSLGRPD